MDVVDSMDAAFTFAINSTLLWETVLGNHVQESTMTCKELLSYLSVMDYSVSKINPLSDDPSDTQRFVDVDCFGNYNIEANGAWVPHFSSLLYACFGMMHQYSSPQGKNMPKEFRGCRYA